MPASMLNPNYGYTEHWIHDRSCELLVFLSALAQKRHPATKSSRRITGVNRDLNVFRFCNKLIFTGVGFQPPAQPPTLRARGVTLRLVSTLRPVWNGWPYQEYKTPADIALGVIETCKPSLRDKVVTPWDGYRTLTGVFFRKVFQEI